MNTVNSLRELPKLFDKPQESTGGGADNMLEVMRLIREIHAAVCGQKTDAEDVVRRKRFRHVVLELMVPDQVHIAENFVVPLKERGIETTVAGINAALIKLAVEKQIVRVRAGIYRLPDSTEQTTGDSNAAT